VYEQRPRSTIKVEELDGTQRQHNSTKRRNRMTTGLSRRSFLGQASAGAAVASVAAMAPNLVGESLQSRFGIPSTAAAGSLAGDGASVDGHIVAHVRDVASGEILVMVGTREIVYRDRKLAQSLARAARSATTTSAGSR